MHEIFLSYRVADSSYPAAAVFDHLVRTTRAAIAFRDSDSMRAADHYPSTIRAALRRSYAVVALVGPQWAGEDVGGARRIDQPGDWVRSELAYAFANEIPVVPVVLDDAPDLATFDLPAGLEPLRRVQTLWLGHRRWAAGLDELTTVVRRFLPADATGGADGSPPSGVEPSSAPPAPHSVTTNIRDGVHADKANFGFGGVS